MKKNAATSRTRSRAITKKVPAGGRASSAKTQADMLSGRVEPALAGAPSAGARPNPGPVPAVREGDVEDLRHQPIRWNYPYATNANWTPRKNALTPFSVLRSLAEVSDIIRICIETRKDQMCSLGWDIVPRDKKGQVDKHHAKINEARAFFLKPDKRRSFTTWLRMAIEDVLVIDALSVYRRRTRGGGLYSLELKDGSTFLPLLAEDGDYPLPPAVAFRQIINGVPIEGGDCSLDQLYYRPRTVRTHTPYGLSPTEAVLLTVNAALNRELFNLQYYTEGNVPEGLLEVPKGFNTKQLIEFQDYLDEYLSGDLARRRKLKAVHEGGSKVYQFKEPDFATLYDEWLLKVICAAYAVPPQEIGFTGDVNKATGQMQENVSYRRGVKPLGGFFKELFDEVLALDLGWPELEWAWTGGEVEDKLATAQTDAIYVGMGKVSVDELRLRDGQEPIGMGPYIETPMGPIFVEELLNADPDGDPDTSEVDNPANAGGDSGDSKKDPKNPEQKPPKDDDVTEETIEDLRRWRAVAVKCVKAKKPIREFASDAIPLELHARVERFLEHAGVDVGKVVTAFDLALAEHRAVKKDAEHRRQTRAELRMAKAVKKLMASHFKRQGAALAAHIKKGLDA